MNVFESFIQGCSGALVEHLAHNLKVRGSRPPCAQLLFRYTAGKFWWRMKLNRKFRPLWQKLFLLYVRNESAAPGLGNGKSRQALKQCTVWEGLSLKTISRYCPFKCVFPQTLCK